MGLPPRDELLVRDAYVSEPYAVDASTALDVVLEYMAAHQVGSAIVTKHGRLAGIFTATDACRIYCEHLRRLFPARSGRKWRDRQEGYMRRRIVVARGCLSVTVLLIQIVTTPTSRETHSWRLESGAGLG